MESKTIARNRKAFSSYEILEKFEAGIALQGTEVKSLRAGAVSLKEAYATIKGGEVYLVDCHIQPYDHGGYANHDPLRPRKLLLHRKEIRRLIGKVRERGLTLVPLSIYFNSRGLVKVQLGLCRGRKAHDKRAVIRERDMKREAERALKEARKL
jgi:SsrA-binding protein